MSWETVEAVTDPWNDLMINSSPHLEPQLFATFTRLPHGLTLDR